MRKTLNQIKEIVNGLTIGQPIKLLVPNNTRRNGSSLYYRRAGIFNGIKQNSYGNDYIEVLIGEKQKKYTYGLYNDYIWVRDENGELQTKTNEYCGSIYTIFC